MSLLRINIDEVRTINVQLRKNTSDLLTVKTRLSASRYSVDSRVLARRNIGARITSGTNSLNSIEAKLENLQLFLNKAMDRYLQAEDRVKNIGNTISKPSRNAFSLLNMNLFKAFSDIKEAVQKDFKLLEKDSDDFIKELDKFAKKTLGSIEVDEKYVELKWNSLLTLGKSEWEKCKKEDLIDAGVTAGFVETVKSMTVDLVVGIFDQVKGIIKDPLKKAEEYGELFDTINAVILPLTPADQVIADKVYNGIWTGVKNGFEKDIVKGDAYTRSKYISSVVTTIASFFIGVGEVEAVENVAKAAGVAKIAEETAKAAEIARVAKLEEEARIAKLAKAEEDAKKAGEVTKGVGEAVGDSIDGIKIIDGKVGGKIPVDDFKNIRTESMHNVNSDTITLGKYKPTVNPDGSLDWTIPASDSYTIMAGDTTYFSLGNEWDVIKNKYNITDEDMFELFNKPALDDAMVSGKTITFSHSPEDFPDCALEDEWDYLKEKGGYTNLIKIGDFWYARK